MSAWDKQVDGSHYKDLPIQPFQYSMANGLDPMQHTAIKYVTRFREKGGIRDLRAAIHTIELLIAWEEAKKAPGNQIEGKAEEQAMEGLAAKVAFPILSAEPAKPLTPEQQALRRLPNNYRPRAIAVPASKTYAVADVHKCTQSAFVGDEILIYLEDEGFTWRAVKDIALNMIGKRYRVEHRTGQTSILMVPHEHVFAIIDKSGLTHYG